MTIHEVTTALSLTPVVVPHAERTFSDVYIGDLLSWVMGRAPRGCLWITIMSNVNVLAVAALADVAAIVLAEDVTLEEPLLQRAEEKGINVLRSSLTAYELAAQLAVLPQ